MHILINQLLKGKTVIILKTKTILKSLSRQTLEKAGSILYILNLNNTLLIDCL